MANERKAIGLLLKNNPGALSRISGLFCRRNFNIDSITSSATTDPAVTRVTITIHDDETVLRQLMLQTARLEDVIEVFFLEPEHTLQRELLLVKLSATVNNRSELREIAAIYKAKIIDLTPESMVFELTGAPQKIDAFLAMLEGYTILEMCRTGITAMGRGPVRVHNRKPAETLRPEPEILE